MNRKIIYPILIIIISGLYNNSLEFLIEKGYTSEFILCIRGVLVIVFALAISIQKKLPLLPQNFLLQFFRLINTGVALFLMLESYKTLSATTVSLLSRLDIPLVIIFSLFLGQSKAWHQIILSVLVIASVGFLTFNAVIIEENTTGFLYSISSVILLSISYLILKKSVYTEHPFLLASIASLGGLIVGLSILFIKKIPLVFYASDSWIFALIAVLTILTFKIGSELYKLYAVEKARIAYVFIPIITMPMEMLFEGKWFSKSQIIITVVLTILTFSICLESNDFKYRFKLRKTIKHEKI